MTTRSDDSREERRHSIVETASPPAKRSASEAGMDDEPDRHQRGNVLRPGTIVFTAQLRDAFVKEVQRIRRQDRMRYDAARRRDERRLHHVRLALRLQHLALRCMRVVVDGDRRRNATAPDPLRGLAVVAAAAETVDRRR